MVPVLCDYCAALCVLDEIKSGLGELLKEDGETKDGSSAAKDPESQSKRTCWRLFSSQMTIISISHSLHIIKELRILKEKREVVEMLLQK